MSRRPQPLLSRASVVGLVSGLIAVAIALGVIDDYQAQVLAATVAGGFALLAPLVAAFASMGQVTPIEDPALVVEGTLVPLVPRLPHPEAQ